MKTRKYIKIWTTIVILTAGSIKTEAEEASPQQSQRTNQLEAIGLTCSIGNGTPTNWNVNAVKQGSFAYKHGIVIGDQIIGVRHRLDGAITDIDLRRGQKIYRLTIGVEPSRATKSTTEAVPPSNQSTAFVVDPNLVAQTSKGIKQGRAPNCWFIASLAALADSPGGPNQIAKLIKKTGTTYRVTFAEQGNWVDVGSTDLSVSSVKEAPIWAQVLDCACQKKYPDPVDGTTGFRILTGQPVHLISPSDEPDQVFETLNQISARKFPAIMGTKPNCSAPSLVPWHAFALVGWDPNSKVATLKDPHGSKVWYFSKQQHVDSRPITENSEGVRFVGDGTIQVSLKAINENFNGIAWAESKKLPEVSTSSPPPGKVETSPDAKKLDPKLAADIKRLSDECEVHVQRIQKEADEQVKWYSSQLQQRLTQRPQYSSGASDVDSQNQTVRGEIETRAASIHADAQRRIDELKNLYTAKEQALTESSGGTQDSHVRTYQTGTRH